MIKEHKDPYEIDSSAPRLAWYHQKVEKTPRHGVLGRNKNCSTERIEVLPNKIECNHFSRHTPSSLKVDVMESGEIIHEKVYASPRPPPKISFKDNWMNELDSEVAGSSKDSQRIQPKLKTQLSRTERPVGEQPAGSFTQEIGKDALFGRGGTKNSRTVRPVDGPPSSQSCVPVSVER